jgi:hypothetical protein
LISLLARITSIIEVFIDHDQVGVKLGLSRSYFASPPGWSSSSR